MRDDVNRSGTEFAPDPYNTWQFISFNGYQTIEGKDLQHYGWAVRPGQVAAVPLPGTALLMALGLVGLGMCRLARRL